MPVTPSTILAFDFGLRRIGVAIGQSITATATPLGVVSHTEQGTNWQQLAGYIDEWRPDLLVVGLPLHVDGSSSDMTMAVKNFVRDLARFKLPIELEDERYSSHEAEQELKNQRAEGLRGRIDKASVDSVAAARIAVRWLEKNNRPEQADSE